MWFPFKIILRNGTPQFTHFCTYTNRKFLFSLQSLLVECVLDTPFAVGRYFHAVGTYIGVCARVACIRVTYCTWMSVKNVPWARWSNTIYCIQHGAAGAYLAIHNICVRSTASRIAQTVKPQTALGFTVATSLALVKSSFPYRIL